MSWSFALKFVVHPEIHQGSPTSPSPLDCWTSTEIGHNLIGLLSKLHWNPFYSLVRTGVKKCPFELVWLLVFARTTIKESCDDDDDVWCTVGCKQLLNVLHGPVLTTRQIKDTVTTQRRYITHTHTHTQQQQSASCIYPQLNVNVKVVYSKTFTIIMTKCFVTIQLNCKVQATYRQHHQDW